MKHDPGAGPAAPEARMPEILVVDDSPATLRNLSEIIRRCGWRPRPAQSGEMALKVAAASPPDLVLLDVRMPGMDGCEVCRRLKRDPKLQDIPVIFVSGLEEAADKVEGFAAGGIDYITKPFQQDEVAARIRSQLELRRLQLSLRRAVEDMEERVRQRTAELEERNRALWESEEQFRALVEHAPEAITVLDVDQGRFVEANSKAEEVFGCGRAELLAGGPERFYPPDQPDGRPVSESRADHDRRALAGEHVVFERRLRRKDGSEQIWEVHLSRLPSAGRRLIRSSFVNVTERRQAEEALRRRNRELALVNRVFQATVADQDPRALLELACRELAEAFELPQVSASLLNEERTALTIVAEYAAPPWASIVNTTISIAENALAMGLRESPRPLVVDDPLNDARLAMFQELLRHRGIVTSLVLPLAVAGDVVGALVMNATEPRHFTDQEVTLAWNVAGEVAGALSRAWLGESRRRLLTAIEQTPESIFITDAHGRILYVNPAFERATGYGRAEALGHTPRLLKSGQHDAGLYRQLWETIRSGAVWHGRLVNRTRQGALVTADAVIAPVRDEQGAIVSYIAIERDVTRELELEKQLRIAQKHEALGTLAGGIAHDFNNVLGGIIGYAELARMSLGERHDVTDYIRQILGASRRAQELVQQILTLARQREQVKVPVEVHLIVKEVVTLIRNVTPSTIAVQQDVDPRAGSVLADPAQIHQVLMNLCSNANHAMRENGGVLRIGLTRVRLDRPVGLPDRAVPAGEYVRLEVTDTGHGIDEATLERIFDPYFTTKPAGEGTGLGLAVVKGIVESHGGAISVLSEPGKGTTVLVDLPRFETPAARDEAPRDGEEEVPGRGRVLLVDDEEPLVSVGTAMLRHLGYEVTGCLRSEEALELFRARPDGFDVVVTDQTMPGLTGIQLAQELHRLRPRLPVVLCTGYSDRVDEESAVRFGIAEYLTKPVTVTALGRAVRAAVTAGGEWPVG